MAAAFTASSAAAHEVLPAIGDMELAEGRLVFDVQADIEGFVAGIDLGAVADTDDAPQAGRHDTLRAMDPAELAAAFETAWPRIAPLIDIRAGQTRLEPELTGVAAGPVGEVDAPRPSTFSFAVDPPAGTAKVTVRWDSRLGSLVLRQNGVEAPYDGYLEPGQSSPGIALGGGSALGPWATFAAYIPVGFDHIVPLGLDHILFVLALFFLSTHLRPLLWQVTAFTAAHTITLALTALGVISLPGSVVEPIIAASIVFVAVENIFTRGLSPWRPAVVFVFGLLHGMGFASVLAEFGLPEGAFVPALLGFNVGVEVGQLFVILIAFLIVREAIRIDRGHDEVRLARDLYILLPGIFVGAAFLWMAWGQPEVGPMVFAIPAAFLSLLCWLSVERRDLVDSYRRIVAVPASAAIALIGAWWFVERVFL
ncbi:HupE / UreJ protein [Wenxinia saemankumensis]|uniref:HupE / UreJ protein n=2 Tax=Wenxinia saemankumensis TaxID=1447782 RepID=A0A1M6A4Q0_9RHOB|nr:HupE / UreJ protein [Wenxinia saemankumensis]